MNLPAQSVRYIVRLVFRCILRPDEKQRRDGGTLLDQFPRLGQMIEQTTAEDRVEFSECSEIRVLEICLRKLDVSHLEKLLDESRLAKIRLATFQRDDAFDAEALRHDESVRAFQRPELQDGFRLRGISEKSLQPFVSDSADSTAVVVPSDPELVDPRPELCEACGEIG
jgi:hypothetical protein